MITKMKKLTFLVLAREYGTFLETLRDMGVVHVIEKQHGAIADDALQADVAQLGRMKTVLAALPESQTAAGTDAPDAAAVMERYDAIMADRAALEQKLAGVARDRAVLQSWGDFDPASVERLDGAGYVLQFFTCPLKAFRPEWVERYNAMEIFQDRQKVNFVTLTHAGETVDIDAEKCMLPQASLSSLEEEAADLSARLDAVPASLESLAASGVPVLKAAVAVMEDKVDFSRVRLTGQPVASDSLYLLEGWIPASQADEACARLDDLHAYYELSDPTPEDDIPVQLSNNRFARLFEPLTRLYMLPSYQELDLTLLFAPFFMLFFGLCLGDMGYGLLMIVALPVFTKLFQLINPSFSKWLVVLFGASTMLCGTLSGTFFGFNIYDLDIPFIQKMKELLYTDNSTMFTVSLCIGVVQILFGMGIKAVNLSIQCGFKAALGTIGWIILLVTVAVCALAGIPFSSPAVLALLGIACVGIFLLNSPGENIFLNIGLGLWDTYNMATGLLGDVLSYVRLFALGLSGGILANVFNSMAVGMKPDNPIAGFIVMVLIFVVGHALNIFMNILGAIVHPMRLTFVEFFKNAGYTGGGMEYRPFGRKTGIAG